MTDTWHHFDPYENDVHGRFDSDTTIWLGLATCELDQTCPSCGHWKIRAILRPIDDSKVGLSTKFVVTELKCTDPFVKCHWKAELPPSEDESAEMRED